MACNLTSSVLNTLHFNFNSKTSFWATHTTLHSRDLFSLTYLVGEKKASIPTNKLQGFFGPQNGIENIPGFCSQFRVRFLPAVVRCISEREEAYTGHLINTLEGQGRNGPFRGPINCWGHSGKLPRVLRHFYERCG